MNKLEPVVTSESFSDTYKSKIFAGKALETYAKWFPLFSSPQLADIAACIISDGYLQVRPRYDSKQYLYFGFYSKHQDELEKFNNKISRLFGIKGVIREVGKRDYGYSKGCIVLNAALTRVLTLCGVPANEKVTQRFSVPKWILNGSKDLKSSFLMASFSCEASIGFDKSKSSWEIRFFANKIRSLYDDGIGYMNSLKGMLKEFGIETSNVFVNSIDKRNKEPKESIGFCFKITRPKSILNYAKYISFDTADKKERLEKAVKWACERAGKTH